MPGNHAMDLMEIFTLVTGVIYIILEIRQKNFMWVVGVFTSLAAMWVFFRQGLYASFGLNTYYLITAFIGLWQWGQDKKKLSSSETVSSGDVIHLNRLPTWWLVRSYIAQWWIWILADTMSTILCATQGMWWMTALYAAYALSAVYGYIHWKMHGRYVSDKML